MKARIKPREPMPDDNVLRVGEGEACPRDYPEPTESTTLLELSFDAIIVRDSNDRVTYFNRGAEVIYGWSRKEAHGRITHELFQTRFPEPLIQIQEKLRRDGRWSGELVHTRRDGSLITVASRWALHSDQAGRVAAILETNTDITERKGAEEALRRREQELAAFFEEAPLGLFWVGLDGRILRINRTGLEYIGQNRGQILGGHISKLSADLDRTKDVLRRLNQGETVANYRLRLRHKGGSVRHFLVDANGFWEEDRCLYFRWFVRDITRHIELEQEVLEIAEREQCRLGQDLHDDLCQQLTGVEYLSQTLTTSLAKASPAVASQVKEIGSMVRLINIKTRDLARGLSPLSLETDGLMSALHELATRTEELCGKSCAFLCPIPTVVSAHTGVHLYRIAQEAVGNAVKHSDAQHIEIRLMATKQGLALEVRDDGIGIPKKVPPPSGMGLRTMQYRAQVISGSLVVQTKPGGGTTIRCEVYDEGRTVGKRKR
jgi:two-component system, LuxR family, sensor kinase FixL